MSDNRFVHRENPKIGDPLFGAFDIETFGLGGAYADGTTFTPEDGSQRHRTVEDLWEALLNPPRPRRADRKTSKATFTWLAHNGARYDFTYLASLIYQYATSHGLTVETTQQATKIVQLTIPTPLGKVKLRDSFPLLGSTLEQASRAFAPQYSKLDHCPDHDFEKGGLYSPDCPVCVRYMHRDAESLYYTYKAARQVIIDNFGIEPAITAGATAVKAWQATIPEGHVYFRQQKPKEDFLRFFTTGAFTSPGSTSEKLKPEEGYEFAAITVDRSAAFAACQYQGGYPVSAGVWTGQYDPDRLGFYRVRTTTPPNVHPVIPLINAEGVKHWATGTGTAYITSEQYQFAEELGYSFQVELGLVFEKTEDVFTTFVKKCEDLEYPPDGSSADPAVKTVAKNMRNSLNGKFNIKDQMDRLYIGLPSRDDAIIVVDEETGLPRDLYTLEEEVEAPYCQPAWYALTVTRQQMEEFRLMMLMPEHARFKFDTDSATTLPSVIEQMEREGHIILGPGYGNYKVEHAWLELQSLGPKNYIGTELVKGSLTNIAKCKGIPTKVINQNREAHQRAAEGENSTLTFESMRSMSEMLKKGYLKPEINRTRTISKPDTALGWVWDRKTKRFTPHHYE